MALQLSAEQISGGKPISEGLCSAAGLALVIAASLAYAKSRSGRRRAASIAEGTTRYARVEMKAEFDDALDDDDLNDNDLL